MSEGFCNNLRVIPLINSDNMNNLNFVLFRILGISFFLATKLNQESRKLPLGHAFPQTHLPLRKPIVIPAPIVTGTIKPRRGYSHPRAITATITKPSSHLMYEFPSWGRRHVVVVIVIPCLQRYFNNNIYKLLNKSTWEMFQVPKDVAD